MTDRLPEPPHQQTVYSPVSVGRVSPATRGPRRGFGFVWVRVTDLNRRVDGSILGDLLAGAAIFVCLFVALFVGAALQ